MNQAIKEQWLAALRSGEYRQGRGSLHRGNTFCCLGVLCDIAAKQGIGKWDGETFFIEADPDDSNTQLPPETIAYWAGLDAPNPMIDESYGLHLALYNDGSVGFDIHPHSFAQLADLIESHL